MLSTFLAIIQSRTVITNLVGLVCAILLFFGIAVPGSEAAIVETILSVVLVITPILSTIFRVNPKSTFRK